MLLTSELVLAVHVLVLDYAHKTVLLNIFFSMSFFFAKFGLQCITYKSFAFLITPFTQSLKTSSF